MKVAGEILTEGYAIDIWDVKEITIKAITDSKFVFIEVPMG